MWSLSSPCIDNAPSISLNVSDVLYYYDEPQIFLSKFGLFDALCIKVDEIESDGLYLVAAISPEKLSALKAGRLSVRGAMWQKDYFIAQTGFDLSIRRLWHVDQVDLPSDMLPEAGAGLRVHHGKVVDTLEQSSAFFSLRFAGESLKAGRMAFSVFKGLVDESYALVRTAFAPPSIANRHSLFDFDITEPAFSSLVIAVQEPTVDEAGLRRATRRGLVNDASISIDAVQTEMNARRQKFFEGVEEIIHITSKGLMTHQQAVHHFFTLDQINEVVPTEKNTLSSVEFSANSRGFSGSISVDDKLGERLRDAHRLAEFETITETGSVVEQNGESNTFILKNNIGRQVTCQLNAEIFKRLSESGDLSFGTRLSVSGKIRKRKRRDYISVEGAPNVLI